MKVEIPAEGEKVIRLTVVRGGLYERRFAGKCLHMHVSIDPTLIDLTCDDCKERLNAVGWLLQMCDHWHHILGLTAAHKAAAMAYEAKRRCRCEHCNKMTRVRPPTPAEVRQFKAQKDVT